MFSSVSNIFSVKPREAESADTRLGIRRHDPDQERSKKKSKDEEEKVFFNDGDEATVSVEALQIFLENFLRSLLQTAGTPAAPVARTRQAPDVVSTNTNAGMRDGAAAYAASAYRQASFSARNKSYFDSAPVQNDAIGLESHEVRTIYSLLSDLNILAQQNVKTLHIERGGTFLQSLVAAVEKGKLQ